MEQNENSVYTFIVSQATTQQLDRFERAIRCRRSTLADKVQRQLQVGSIVTTSGNLSPKYMVGRKGTVLKVNQKTASVKLDHPVNQGRFYGSGTITFPISCLTPNGQVNPNHVHNTRDVFVPSNHWTMETI